MKGPFYLAGFAVCCTAAAMLLQPFGLADEPPENAKPKLPAAVIVKEVLKIEYLEEEISPPNLIVTVTGEVPTGGYSKPRLMRVLHQTPPEDGIQEFVLLAVPPEGPVTQVISTVTATLRWEGYTKDAPWIKGLRVYGTDKGMAQTDFPRK